MNTCGDRNVRLRRTVVLGLLAALGFATGEALLPAWGRDGAQRSVAATGGADDPKGDGVVSSGVALPPIPKVTGSRSAPVASWGKPLPYPIVIDRKTKEFIWQYGETDKTGHKPGLLFYPDGFDIDVFRDRKSAGR